MRLPHLLALALIELPYICNAQTPPLRVGVGNLCGYTLW